MINPIRQKAFKVVHRTRSGNLYSANSCVRKSSFRTLYTPKGLTKAPVGRLMVFRSLEDAERFRNQKSTLQIWECEAFGVKGVQTVLNVNEVQCNSNLVKRFWHAKDQKKAPYGAWHAVIGCPNGSLGARSVRLLKRVY